VNVRVRGKSERRLRRRVARTLALELVQPPLEDTRGDGRQRVVTRIATQEAAPGYANSGGAEPREKVFRRTRPARGDDRTKTSRIRKPGSQGCTAIR